MCEKVIVKEDRQQRSNIQITGVSIGENQSTGPEQALKFCN